MSSGDPCGTRRARRTSIDLLSAFTAPAFALSSAGRVHEWRFHEAIGIVHWTSIHYPECGAERAGRTFDILKLGNAEKSRNIVVMGVNRILTRYFGSSQ